METNYPKPKSVKKISTRDMQIWPVWSSKWTQMSRPTSAGLSRLEEDGQGRMLKELAMLILTPKSLSNN